MDLLCNLSSTILRISFNFFFYIRHTQPQISGVDYLDNFFKGFICIHILVTMDPRHADAEDEQFLLNMIGEG